MTESVLLAIVGSAVGIALTFGLVDFLVTMFPNNIANLNIPRVEALPIDGRVLAFTIAVSVSARVRSIEIAGRETPARGRMQAR